jgi:hypothetical protein
MQYQIVSSMDQDVVCSCSIWAYRTLALQPAGDIVDNFIIQYALERHKRKCIPTYPHW